MAKKNDTKCEEHDSILDDDKCDTDATGDENQITVVDSPVEKEISDSDVIEPVIECSTEDVLIDEEKKSFSDNTKILEELDHIRELFSKRLSYDKSKDEAFERLYLELDEIKRNRAFEDSRPLFTDLILFYDRMQSAIIDAEPKGANVLESLLSELKEILYRREIDTINNESDVFDPSFQRAVNSKTVESDELNGKVIKVLREGFVYRGIVLRPEEVVVGCYQQPDINTVIDEK